jgi:hypothetical protein
MNVYEHKWIFMNINECKWTFMKNLNVPKNDKERNIFQNVLKRSQKINVNVQNSKTHAISKIFFMKINS